MREIKCSACTIFPHPSEDGTPVYGLLTNCMDGDGPLDASILILGEAGGGDEDRIGKPFQGRAGQKLTQMLTAAGIDRKSIRLTNSCRCRPTKYKTPEPGKPIKPWMKLWDNRTPTFEEIQACRHWLLEEIQAMPNLKLIIPTGNSPLAALLNEPVGSGRGAKKGRNVSSMRGSIFYSEELGCHILPTYHPAYILRSPNLERHVIRDLKHANDFVNGVCDVQAKTKYYYFRTPEEAKKLFASLRKSRVFAFDTETTSKDRFYGEKILNITFSWSPGTAVYLPIWEGTSTSDSIALVNTDKLENYWVKHYGDDVWLEIYAELKSIFEDPEIKLVGHNLKFDCKFLYASLNTDGQPLSIRAVNLWFDTMIAHFMLDENSKHGLKELAEEFTDMGAYDSELDDVYADVKKLCTRENAHRAKIVEFLTYYSRCGEDLDSLSGLVKAAKPIAKRLLNKSLTTKTTPEELRDVVNACKELDITELVPHYGMIPLETLEDYANRDSDCTWRLYTFFTPLISDGGYSDVFYNLRMPILVPILEAELDGLCVDVQKTHKLEEAFTARRTLLQAGIFKRLGRELNLASTLQLRDVLFTPKDLGGLGLKPLSKTKGGQPSTNKSDLDKLAETSNNPILRDIITWRRLGILTSTFLVGMRNAVDDYTGKVHPNFKVTSTQTHRIVCENPNLLNIPRDDPGSSDEENPGSKIRQIFVPDNSHMTEDTPIGERHVFVEADLSQAEIRTFASLSGDKNLTELLERGIDLHAYFANVAYHKDAPIDDLSLFKTDPQLKTERSKAKGIVFGTIYQQTAAGAEQKLGIPQEEAQQIIDEFYALCPDGNRWIHDTQRFAQKNGYVVTPWGVRRHLPILLQDSHDENKQDKAEALRIAVNSPIQTHASDYNSASFVVIYNELTKAGVWFKPKLIIYDSIILECMLKDSLYVSSRLYKAMTRKAKGFNIKMEADIEILDRWSGFVIDVEKSLQQNELVAA